MDCTESLTLLSEYHASALKDQEAMQVRVHLTQCDPCAGVFRDLEIIIESMSILRRVDDASLPDENVLWQRMNLTKRVIH